ncbi:hypothetical protein ENSA7_62990 [Enhygromyxa salina]|uniref:Uncharacterized protein n=1 Tax=Enhygromyxa salina TaxID=215803 RepID=A0A2S9Y3I5_9BACT|nr:hypothetical protein ENSA7_62990 [Enhygromyxa salina]
MRGETLFVLSLLVACGPPPADPDCDGMCQPAGPKFPGVGECKQGLCTPTYGECATQSNISTCAEACEAQGSSCVANGCAGSTYRLYSVLEWCEDPDRIGLAFEHECDDAIDWQVNQAVQCCCTQE